MNIDTVHARPRSNVLTRNIFIATLLALAFTTTEARAGGSVSTRTIVEVDTGRVALVGARPYIHGGRTYYVAGGVYYRPYRVGRVVYYRVVPPPVRVVAPGVVLPAGRVVVTARPRRVVHVHAHRVVRR